MSSSLPRIKTLHEMGKPQRSSSTKDLKVKFRKIAIEQTDNKEQRKKSMTNVKTDRLKTLERFTTIEEKRQYKNEKIYLNLIERKLLSGTYDEKQQTSVQLNAIKQKRDQMKVEMTLKQKQIERIRLLLDDVKQVINEYLSKKGQHDEKFNHLKQKLEAQLIKTENARESKNVLENMIRTRQEINLVLNKRCNNLKQLCEQLASAWSLSEIQQRQSIQKCSIQQFKLLSMLQQTNKQRNERNDEVIKYQDKINKRKEGEVTHVEKSKQYVAQLDNLEHRANMKQFHQIYDKILANMFLGRQIKSKMINQMAKYADQEKYYSEAASYKAFDHDDPSNFVNRFFQHQPQHNKLKRQIQEKQEYISVLQSKFHTLKKKLSLINAQLDQGQPPSQAIKHLQILTKQRQRIKQVKNEYEEIEEKTMRIKNYILKSLGKFRQKGQKNIFNGTQSTVNNLTLLTNIIQQSFKTIN